MFWIFWIIVTIIICATIIKSHKNNLKDGIIECTVTAILLLCVPIFYIIGTIKDSTLLSVTGVLIFVGYGVIALFSRLILKIINNTRLKKSKEIVMGEIVRLKEMYSVYDYSTSKQAKIKSKYKIMFKYIDSKGNEKECRANKFYTIEEANAIKGMGDSIELTVAGKVCKINKEISVNQLEEDSNNSSNYNEEKSQQENIRNLKNMPIQKMGANTGELVGAFSNASDIIGIIMLIIVASLVYLANPIIGIVIVTFFCFPSIIAITKRTKEQKRTMEAYKEGKEDFALKFYFKVSNFYGRGTCYYIVYSFKTDVGVVVEKKQLVMPHIYQNAHYMEKLPIKVFGSHASVDIDKIEKFTENI